MVCIYVLQQFPREIFRSALRPKQKEIQMYDVQGHKFYNCKILTAKRNIPDIDNHEKYIGHDWYEYAKKQIFCCGDVLSFRMLNMLMSCMFILAGNDI